ncbi:MAG TPA: hypothetical protein DCG75_03405 [Bacteroidales bacterium]|nr:hypothetical protein [Bacteroidales bacterium]
MKNKNYIFLIFLIVGLTGNAQWQQVGSDINGEANNSSGKSVSISSDGSILAIGTSHSNGNGQDRGHVRVLKNNSGTWEQIGDDIYGEADYDYFGWSVSLSSDGSIVAIGTPYNDGNGNSAGHVRVFKNNSGIWEQIGEDIDGEAKDDSSGYSISLSSNGSIVAIGAPFNDGIGTSAGHVRVYINNSGIWEQIGDDIDGEAARDLSGWSVSLSSDGSIVAVGAQSNDGNGDGAGHVRVFQNNSGIWEQIGEDIDGEAASDGSGFSVSLSSDGSIVAVGATYNDGNGRNAGHVRVFKNNSGIWEQIGGDIDGEAEVDLLGWSVSLSSDGSVFAVGAPWNDENGTSAGHVRVFQNNSEIWEQIGEDINGKTAGSFYGESISLSSDGSIVAIGSPYNNENGELSGQVRVFQNDFLIGIIEAQQNPDIFIYPNPTTNSLSVKSEKLKIESITISDLSGKEILYYKAKIAINEYKTDLSNLENAVYIIRIQTEKDVFTTKIIKR